MENNIERERSLKRLFPVGSIWRTKQDWITRAANPKIIEQRFIYKAALDGELGEVLDKERLNVERNEILIVVKHYSALNTTYPYPTLKFFIFRHIKNGCTTICQYDSQLVHQVEFFLERLDKD